MEVATRPKRTTPLWYRIAPIAAALVLVVGVGSILLNRGGSMATETTVAAASAPLDAYSSPQAESSNRGLSGTGKSDAGGAAPTTISPSQDTTAMAAPATTAQATNTTAPPRRLSAEQLPQAATEFARTARPAALDPDLDQCLSQDALAPDDPFADEKVIVDDQLAWLVAFGTQGDVSAVVVYGENDCAVFFRT